MRCAAEDPRQVCSRLKSRQVCTSTSRIYVHESIYDQFLKRFIEVVKEHERIGSPFSNSAWQGPQVSKAQYDKILSYIESGKKAGGRLLHGGTNHGGKGYYIRPTVFADVGATSSRPVQARKTLTW